MDLLTIYEKVSLKAPIEERRFFNWFNDTVIELESMYAPMVCEPGETFTPVSSFDDICPVRPLYAPAIVDNILFLSGDGEQNNAVYKQEFLRKAERAYLNYWHAVSHRRHIKSKGSDADV